MSTEHAETGSNSAAACRHAKPGVSGMRAAALAASSGVAAAPGACLQQVTCSCRTRLPPVSCRGKVATSPMAYTSGLLVCRGGAPGRAGRELNIRQSCKVSDHRGTAAGRGGKLAAPHAPVNGLLCMARHRAAAAGACQTQGSCKPPPRHQAGRRGGKRPPTCSWPLTTMPPGGPCTRSSCPWNRSVLGRAPTPTSTSEQSSLAPLLSTAEVTCVTVKTAARQQHERWLPHQRELARAPGWRCTGHCGATARRRPHAAGSRAAGEHGRMPLPFDPVGHCKAGARGEAGRPPCRPLPPAPSRCRPSAA